ncbi:replication initiation protein [Fodinicurvata sediminis]|uniref:replication initiation protein n=1 Tax=Fodinicurvata sediminis TaxID=1121832 RepID=UPI0004023336|nr:replication initiation protein [Fodinicurvata sediminis]
MSAPNPKVKSNKNSLSDKNWQEYYDSKYKHHSERNRARKEDRRARERRRKREFIDPLAARDHDERRDLEEKAGLRDLAIQNARSKNDSVRSRLKYGFLWLGGAVGGDARYYQPRFRYHGLVSDEHELLKLFVQYTPRAGVHRVKRDRQTGAFISERNQHTLRSGHTKAESESGDSKLLALDDEYITANARMRGLIRIDLDADFATTDAVLSACDAAKIPHPNIIVGYVDRDGRMMHPHLLYMLHDPVAFCGKAKSEFKALWHKVSRGLTHALAPVGADSGGLSNPLRTKNPLCPAWTRRIGAQQPYSLSQLARYVDLSVTDEALFSSHQDIPARSACTITDPEKPSMQLFNELRLFARDIAPARIAAGANEDEFYTEIIITALEIAARTGSTEADARKTAASVAKYSWYKARNAKPTLSAEELHSRQATAAQRTAEVKRSKTFNAIMSAYNQLQADGEQPTQKAVAAASGKSERTVRNHWQAMLDAVAENAAGTAVEEPAISSSSVKKKRSSDDFENQHHGNNETKVFAEGKPKPPDFNLITLNRNPKRPTSPSRREMLYQAWRNSKNAA